MKNYLRIDNFEIKIDEESKSFKRIEITIVNEKKKYQTQTFDTEQDFLKWYNDVRI